MPRALVRELGGHEVFVNGECVEIYPLPTQVYTSVGYRRVELSVPWARGPVPDPDQPIPSAPAGARRSPVLARG